MDSFLSMLDSIPEDSIAVTVYLLGSLLILWCWYSIAHTPAEAVGWHHMDDDLCPFY